MGRIIQQIQTYICLDDLFNCTDSFPMFTRGLLMQSTFFTNSREMRSCSLKMLTSICQRIISENLWSLRIQKSKITIQSNVAEHTPLATSHSLNHIFPRVFLELLSSKK